MESQSEKTSVRAVCIERCKHGSEGGVAQSRPDYTLLPYINVWWYKRLGVTPEMVLHPEINIILGAYILGENVAVWDLTWKAVAAYHTPPNKNPTRAVDYAKRIWSIYKKKG